MVIILTLPTLMGITLWYVNVNYNKEARILFNPSFLVIYSDSDSHAAFIPATLPVTMADVIL